MRNTAVARVSLVLAIAFVLSLWYCAQNSGAFYGDLPSPQGVARLLLSPWIFHSALPALAITLKSALLAVVIGVTAGVAVGLGIGLTRPFTDGFYDLFNSLRVVPVSVLIPLALSLFGLRRFVLPLLVLPVAAMMIANVVDAVSRANRGRRKLLSLYGISGVKYIRHILFFELLEVAVATLRIAIPFALTLEVAIDYFLHVDGGIGALISDEYQTPDHRAPMYAAIIVVAVTGLLIVRSLDATSSRTLAWKRDM